MATISDALDVFRVGLFLNFRCGREEGHLFDAKAQHEHGPSLWVASAEMTVTSATAPSASTRAILTGAAKLAYRSSG